MTVKAALAQAIARLRRAGGLRMERQYLIGRAVRRHAALRPVRDRTGAIAPDTILAFMTLRNEFVRLPYVLDYYRRLGVGQFLIVDNDSTDGGREWLAAQPDVSLWRTAASYKTSRFGMDWLGWLLFRHGHGHWCLTVDPDELLVYPHCDTRPLQALTHWLETAGQEAFPAMLLDLYPRGQIDDEPYRAGDDPTQIARWFDPANYVIRKNRKYRNLWIQGGPRMRTLFATLPDKAPALNKTPLVRWNRRYAYVSSTHMLLPTRLNRTYDEDGGEAASGCLLHTKFLSTFQEKAAEELDRRQHYADSREYRAYHAGLRRGVTLWCEHSRRYEDWRQLEALGLMSRGNWA